MVQAVDYTIRGTKTDYRFIREPRGGITISNVMLEDDGVWQCEAENARGYIENARPTKLIVLGKTTKHKFFNYQLINFKRIISIQTPMLYN